MKYLSERFSGNFPTLHLVNIVDRRLKESMAQAWFFFPLSSNVPRTVCVKKEAELMVGVVLLGNSVVGDLEEQKSLVEADIPSPYPHDDDTIGIHGADTKRPTSVTPHSSVEFSGW